MPSFNEITAQNLMRRIGLPDAPLIIDVRDEDDFPADPRAIPTAQHYDYHLVDEWAPRLAASNAGRQIVVTCQRGIKLSQGVAGFLRTEKMQVETLEGGHLGWVAAGLPLVPVTALGLPNPSLWVTRHRPKIDRIACPWLIRRFVDPAAKFLFVAPNDVMAVAEKFGAIPFDIENVQYSHQGENCSFDTMLDLFDLKTDALLRLATVVRGADTNRHDLAPEAAGLLALSTGLSRMYRDDVAQLEAGMALYDALYRWARDGFNEGHNWPADRPAK